MEQVCAFRACLPTDHRKPDQGPGMEGNGTSEAALGASQSSTKNKSRVGFPLSGSWWGTSPPHPVAPPARPPQGQSMLCQLLSRQADTAGLIVHGGRKKPFDKRSSSPAPTASGSQLQALPLWHWHHCPLESSLQMLPGSLRRLPKASAWLRRRLVLLSST